MSKRKRKNKGKVTKAPRLNDGDRIIQAAVQNMKTTTQPQR